MPTIEIPEPEIETVTIDLRESVTDKSVGMVDIAYVPLVDDTITFKCTDYRVLRRVWDLDESKPFVILIVSLDNRA